MLWLYVLWVYGVQSRLDTWSEILRVLIKFFNCNRSLLALKWSNCLIWVISRWGCKTNSDWSWLVFCHNFWSIFWGYWTKRDIPEYYLVCSSEARAKSLMTLVYFKQSLNNIPKILFTIRNLAIGIMTIMQAKQSHYWQGIRLILPFIFLNRVIDFQISLVFEELLYESLPVWFGQSQRPFRQGILKEPHKYTLFMDINIRLQFLHHRAELTSNQGIEQTFIHFFFNVHKNGFV